MLTSPLSLFLMTPRKMSNKEREARAASEPHPAAGGFFRSQGQGGGDLSTQQKPHSQSFLLPVQSLLHLRLPLKSFRSWLEPTGGLFHRAFWGQRFMQWRFYITFASLVKEKNNSAYVGTA